MVLMRDKILKAKNLCVRVGILKPDCNRIFKDSVNISLLLEKGFL